MPEENINTRTSDKKKGTLHDQDTRHVASQDSLKKTASEEE